MKQLFVLHVFLLIMAGCVSAPPVSRGASVTASGGNGKSLAILAPKAAGLAVNQNYIPALVQGELVSNFSSYSGLSVLDRQRLDEQYEELLSGYYNDNADAGLDLGKLPPTDYILSGSITKTSAGYSLQISIVKTAGKMTAASYSGSCTLAELDNLSGIRRASLDLLQKMGIELTASAKMKLAGAAAESHVNAQTALARGITAEKTGATLVEVMQYYYRAVDYDSEMIEAINRLAGTNKLLTNLSQPQTVVRTGNIRKDALAEIAAYRIEQENKRIDSENKQVWIQQLADCENYFTRFFETANAPLELVYSTNITPGGVNKVTKTISLSFEATLLPLKESWFNAAQQTIAAVRKGLMETGRAYAWELAGWPQKNVLSVSPFVNNRREYAIDAALLDDTGKIIGTSSFLLHGGWDCSIFYENIAFIPYYDGTVVTVIFNDIKIADITDVLSIQIITINGQDAKTASENGVLAITVDNARTTQAVTKMQKERKRQVSREAFERWSEIKFGINVFCMYIYDIHVPSGLSAGIMIERFGGYAMFGLGEDFDKRGYSSAYTSDMSEKSLVDKQEYSYLNVLFGVYYRLTNIFCIDVGLGFSDTAVSPLYYASLKSKPSEKKLIWAYSPPHEIDFVFQVGLLYTFHFIYLSTGYRQYVREKYTPSFYIGVGVGVGWE